MSLSLFDMFSIGIGPSSSHTVGPMRAAGMFVAALRDGGQLARTSGVRVELYGSLGATGVGHGTDKAVVLGLGGESPETVDTAGIEQRMQSVRASQRLELGGIHGIAFSPDHDIVLHRRRTLPGHPNGMTFHALDVDGADIRVENYYSVGGGFVVGDEDAANDELPAELPRPPYAFATASELLAHCTREGSSVAEIAMKNEVSLRPEGEVREGILRIWRVMQECVINGCTSAQAILPGGLRVPRRAPSILASLQRLDPDDPLRAMDWVNLFALAVNEENAAGGRVVTAPTNGAAGIVPAVLHYYARFVPGADDDGVVRFLLTAAAIGMLFKQNASISGAEVGCQGEVGSACAMAAAGLCEVLGGSPAQVENAAEIGIEHNLGLTCDPVGGLVQIPCIERNAIASVKAINAARMAMHGDGVHHVALDTAIETMRQVGADMKSKYKETSRGGLALNVPEC